MKFVEWTAMAADERFDEQSTNAERILFGIS